MEKGKSYEKKKKYIAIKVIILSCCVFKSKVNKGKLLPYNYT